MLYFGPPPLVEEVGDITSARYLQECTTGLEARAYAPARIPCGDPLTFRPESIIEGVDLDSGIYRTGGRPAFAEPTSPYPRNLQNRATIVNASFHKDGDHRIPVSVIVFNFNEDGICRTR